MEFSPKDHFPDLFSLAVDEEASVHPIWVLYMIEMHGVGIMNLFTPSMIGNHSLWPSFLDCCIQTFWLL